MSEYNTKDWANIRIEEPVRDDARDDPRTYTEIMRAGLDAPNPENDAGPGPGPFDAHAEISVSVPDEDLERIRDDVADAVDDAGTLDARIVDMDATERQRLAEAIAEVLGR